MRTATQMPRHEWFRRARRALLRRARSNRAGSRSTCVTDVPPGLRLTSSPASLGPGWLLGLRFSPLALPVTPVTPVDIRTTSRCSRSPTRVRLGSGSALATPANTTRRTGAGTQNPRYCNPSPRWVITRPASLTQCPRTVPALAARSGLACGGGEGGELVKFERRISGTLPGKYGEYAVSTASSLHVILYSSARPKPLDAPPDVTTAGTLVPRFPCKVLLLPRFLYTKMYRPMRPPRRRAEPSRR